MQEINVTEKEAGQRLDKLLAKCLRRAPKSFLYKMLRKKNITLNGHKASGAEKLVLGDQVKLFLSEETFAKFSEAPPEAEASFPKELKILYEDRHILLFNKPAGMLSQKAKKTDISAVEYLIFYLLSSRQITREELTLFRPSVINRLDRNTSGILAAGKTLAGLQEMSRFFKERTIQKYYLCLVNGIVKEPALVKGYLYKEEKTNRVQIADTPRTAASPIETAYRPVCTGEDVTLLSVHLLTGRPHQIRAHLAQEGHSLVGDYKYGDCAVNDLYKKRYGLKSQLLHAYKLKMPSSAGVLSYLSGREFTADPPEIFCRIAKDKGVM